MSWKPSKCSECPKKLKPHPHAGRPRETCSLECLAVRRSRLKREKREFAARNRANAEYLAEFRNPANWWTRGGR